MHQITPHLLNLNINKTPTIQVLYLCPKFILNHMGNLQGVTKAKEERDPFFVVVTNQECGNDGVCTSSYFKAAVIHFTI